MPHLIEMRKVSKFYSNNGTVSTGFSKVDLNLDMGEFVVITGESGGGKSTLLNVISGLDTYEEGEMFVAGQDTSAFRTEDYEKYRKKYIGNIFQDYNLINSYTVYQNIELVLLMNGKKRRYLKNGIMKILEWVGMRKYARTRVSRLSGGQKQRVAIARAFAKNAPIIVADEPTGNLDSESAAKVLEILHDLSRDKLVIVVTHNYEQVEPYATRKIMMKDGRIIEDRKLKQPEYFQEFVPEPEDKKAQKKSRLSGGSRLRLGLRNTFNLPAKFLLLLFIYMFLSSAVIGSYASMLSSEHTDSLMGYNQYFADTSPERIILQKQDGSAFTEADYTAIENTENVDHIVRNDLSLDRTLYLETENLWVEGPGYSAESLQGKKLLYGRLPEKTHEIVIGVDEMSEPYEELKENGESYLGKKYHMQTMSMNEGSGRIPGKKVEVVGIVQDEISSNSGILSNGYCRIYISDKLSDRIVINNVASTSRTTFTYGETSGTAMTGQMVYPAEQVDKGHVYLAEDDAYGYFEEGKALQQNFGIKVKNHYFTAEKKLVITQLFKPENMESLLGMKKDDYDYYMGAVFINPDDFADLYDQGNFQISAFLKNESYSDRAVETFKSMGFKPLPMKDVKSDITGGYEVVEKMLHRILLAVLFIVLFFIAYAVIRLIMRSRHTYYSTMRILGATKGNISAILRIELLTVMVLAVTIVMVLIYLVNHNYILAGDPIQETVKSYFEYMKPKNYAILYVVMLGMSLLISGRYSRKIFGKSAMIVYRGEA